MITLAIDPGKNTGWARFADKCLDACGLVPDVGLITVYGDEMVIELPQVYRGRFAKGDPNDLIELAAIVGRAEQLARDSLMSVRKVKPRDWKGTIKKKIHNARVLKALDSAEAWRFGQGVVGVAAGVQHNVIDAVGLGLWAVGRGV